MAKHGGSKEEMLAQRAMQELEVQNAISSAERQAARLSFESVIAEVNERLTKLTESGEAVARARARGYIWAADLEQKLQAAQALAGRTQETVRTETQRAARELRGRADQLNARAQRLRGRPPHTVIYEAQSVAAEASGVDSAIDAAEGRVREAVKPFTETVDALVARLASVHFTLDCFESASFRLQPEENPLLAVKATWEDSPQGKREGVLLLTAHRIRFEHQEEVVLERSFIFFASRTETRKALLLDALVGAIGSSDDVARGVVFKDQLLVLSFRPGSNVQPRATFELDGVTAKELDTTIEQLRTGDLARTRYQGPMPENSNVGVPVRWPSNCDNCGAALTPPVRGQDIIACDYCGAKHPVELGQA